MLYSCLWRLGRVLFFLLGLKSKGIQNVPDKGPLIVVANHVSIWDPIVVALVLKRPIHFMAKIELFKYSFLGKLLKKLNAFPVKRGAADRTAIKHAIYILEEGKVLGIFPEGTRNKNGEKVEKSQMGAAMIALKTGTPVLPVACIGTKRTLPLGWFSPLEVRIGEPLYLDEFKGQKVNSALMAQVSNIVTDEINTLLID